MEFEFSRSFKENKFQNDDSLFYDDSLRNDDLSFYFRFFVFSTEFKQLFKVYSEIPKKILVSLLIYRDLLVGLCVPSYCDL
jgi:hypothetical protein